MLDSVMNVSAVVVSIMFGLGWFVVLLIPILIVLGLAFSPMFYGVSVGVKKIVRKRLEMKLYHSKMQILVADDDEVSVAPLIAALASEAECEITYAKDGIEASAYLRKFSYKLVFIDYLMPDKCGDRALLETDLISLKHFNEHIKTPVVFYTNHLHASESLKALTLDTYEVCDVWSKNTPFPTLTTKLNRLMDKLDYHSLTVGRPSTTSLMK